MGKRLGKGLDALIPETANKDKQKVEKIKLTDIVPNPFQPRKRFGEKKMEELVSSVKEKGVIQPILVRPAANGYEIIAGERRWRAAQELQINEIPAIVRTDIDDVNSLEISIIENIQREELNPIEEARAFRELNDKFKHTLEIIGTMMGKDKTTISNSLRLLGLSEDIQFYIEDGDLSAGHAKVLLSVLGDQKRKRIAKTIIEKGLSVRETENLVQKTSGKTPRTRKIKDPEISSIEEELRHKLGTKINILHGKKRGKIEIQYYSNDDLQRLLHLILQ